MKERKNIIIAVICLLILITLIEVPKLFLNNKEENILPEVKLKNIEKDKAFAIMVSDNTGKYVPYKGDEWPDDDNFFYSHSECVDNNGEKIENAIVYNEEENTALLDTNQTVYCTLYFDKYNYMKVITHNVQVGENSTSVPDYISSKVKKVEFVDYIKDDLKSNEENTRWWDISDESQGTLKGSVIAWIEPIDNNYDTLYIGSKTIIRAIYLSRAFMASEYSGDNTYSAVSNLESINFNDRLDTSKTVYFVNMFAGNTKLTKIEGIEKWNTGKVTNIGSLFFLCNNLEDISGLKNWDVSNVETMGYTFANCTKLSDISVLANWKITEKLKGLNWTFAYCEKLTNIEALRNWNVSNVTTMSLTFAGCKIEGLEPISNWNTSKVTDMHGLFLVCNVVDITPIQNWNVSNVETMEQMFSNCQKLKNVDLSSWNTCSLINIRGLFRNCNALTNINLKNWNISNVSEMVELFRGCINLEIVDLNTWDTKDVTNMYGLFEDCKKLATVNMSNASFNQIKDYDKCIDIFTNVPESATIIIKADQKDWIQNTARFPGKIQTV